MKFKTNDMVKASIFLALGLILPYFFHLMGMAGTVFLPMHIPVLLCGFILGSRYGLIVGLVTPLLSSVLTGMPPIYPIGISMCLELAMYGFISGFLYKEKGLNIFIALIIAMLAGRAVSGVANYALFTMGGKPFVFKMFLTGSFVKGMWGILIQLIFIPIIMKALEKTNKGRALNG